MTETNTDSKEKVEYAGCLGTFGEFSFYSEFDKRPLPPRKESEGEAIPPRKNK